MNLRLSPRKRRRALIASGVGLLLIAVICLRVGPGRRWFSAEPAHIEIVNLCDKRWNISAAAPGRRTVLTWQIEPNATLPVELPGGDYLIGQTLLSGKAVAGRTRTFSMHLEARESYRWKLVTLQTLDETRGAKP